MMIELNATGQSRGGQVGPLNPMPVTSGGTAADGTALPANFDSLQRNFTYNGDGTVATEYRTDTVSTWTKTFTYVSGNTTAISKWVVT